MENNMVLNGFGKSDAEIGLHPEPEAFGEITDKLDDILLYLRNELHNKQQIINRQAVELARMRSVIELKNEEINHLQTGLTEVQKKAESNRQLINKLLGDISHYQNDIEWYKRTYEKRSFWGVMKEKLAKVNPPPENTEQ